MDYRICPVCETQSERFGEFGRKARTDAQCPRCGALERHRLVWIYFKRYTNLFDGKFKRVLHIAPEKCFTIRIQELLGEGYVTADLQSPHAMVKMDIMDIPYPEHHFDAIYCSHVLEHVPDDKKAMQELLRVLKPDGWAVLLVPMLAEKTFEDPAVIDPKERLSLYGQEDHVRAYGPDYIDRLRSAGFNVKRSSAVDFLNKNEILAFGLSNSPEKRHIYYCTKSPTPIV